MQAGGATGLEGPFKRVATRLAGARAAIGCAAMLEGLPTRCTEATLAPEKNRISA